MNIKKLIVLFSLASIFTFAQAVKQDGLFAEITTNKGKILLQLEFEKTPITVANFVSLAEGKNDFVSENLKKKPFFDGLKFHRVIPNFMIQGGDPAGNGSGGPGYKFTDEISDLKHDKPGVLSMANAGAGTNGSQFFITHKDTPWLDGKHTVFGYVVTGQEVVNKIQQNDVIEKVTIIRNGKLAKKFHADKVFKAYMDDQANQDKIIAAKNEDIKKKQAEAIETERKAKETLEAKRLEEAKAKALKEFEVATTTPSGIKYIVLQEGLGKQPLDTNIVKVHYTGMFVDGKVFDSSVQRGEPVEFPLNKVIPGWTEGVQLMKEGAKYKFYLPSNLAYGERGAGGVIPPNADLIFEVELLEVK
ncbi:MAG: peptidylprolyl isomerase [Flavobacterium sp.]|nr:peptidylprolyl isomerase [Flavobacterium sp.]